MRSETLVWYPASDIPFYRFPVKLQPGSAGYAVPKIVRHILFSSAANVFSQARQGQAQCAKCRHGAKHFAKPQRAKDNEFFYTEMLDRCDVACILCKGIRKCQGEFPDSDLSGMTVKQQEEFAAELTQLSCHLRCSG